MMTKITVPPKPAEPVVIGEIDLDLVRTHGRTVHVHECQRNWIGRAVDIAGGSLLFIPCVSKDAL